MSTKLVMLELGQPLPATIANAETYDCVWVTVMRYGVPVGRVIIDNKRTPVLRDQLRSEIARQLAFSLMEHRNYALEKEFAWAAGLHPVVPQSFAEEPELAILERELQPKPGQRFFLSVVVCTCDRPDDLRRCLESLVRLNPGRHQLEIIVVDNRPASGLSGPITAQFSGVRYEAELRPGVAYGRNKGLMVARGDIVAYIDDDVIVPPHWPTRILAPFSDERVMCVSGLVLPFSMETHSEEMFEKYGALGRGYRPRLFDSRFFHWSDKHVVHTWELGGTANIALRKCVIAQTGMFDETLGPGLPTGVGEDIYMFYRILKAGHICYYEPAAYAWHKHRNEMKALRRQLYNYNKGQTSYQLRTLVSDGDRRAIRQLLWDLPRWHLRRIVEILLGRQDYSLRLVAVEIWGNLVGFLAFYRANRMHRRLNGPGANPIQAINDLEAGQRPECGDVSHRA